MPKYYALALILTGIIVFSSLLYLQHQFLTTKHQEAFVYAEAVQQRTIELKREQLDELVMKTNTLLQDDTKERFRPILPFIDDARAGEEELISAAGALAQGNTEELKQLLQQRTDLLAMLYDSAAGLLEAHGHQIDLSPDDIETKTANLRKIVDQVSTPPVDYFAEPAFSLQRDLIVLDYLNILEEVLVDVIQISGGKIISCFFGPEFFPLVSASFSNPRLGETIETRVSVGSFSTSLDVDNVFLLVNGDTLRLRSDGTLPYDFVATKRGRQTLEMELYVTNPLTGEVKREADGQYSYYVR